MERPVRKKLTHAIPQWVADGSSFFVTIKCMPRGRNHLCRAGVGDAVLAAALNYQVRSVWICRLLVLMPDHLHAIIAFPKEPGLRTVVSNWKRYLARTAEVSWQRDFFDHRLRDHHQLSEKVSYVAMNPVRWGLCERPEEWPWRYRGIREGPAAAAR